MAIASIDTWLKNPNKSYLHGKMLYAQYGDKEHLKALFESGSSSFHFSKLQKALQDLNLLDAPKPKNILIAELPKPTVASPQPLMEYANAPAQIQKIRDDKNKAYSLARKIFEMIPYMESQAHRLEAGKELLAHRKFVQECWEAIDDWKNNGIVRELKVAQIETDVTELTVPDLIKEQKNLPPNISKDRTKLKKCTDAGKKLKLLNRINEREMRLELIKRRLSELV